VIVLLERSRDCPSDDGRCTRGPHGARERVDGCARRDYVVDERDAQARVAAFDTEGAGDVAESLGKPERALGRSGLAATNPMDMERNSELCGHRPRDLDGLVVAALAQPRSMQRHGNERIGDFTAATELGAEQEPQRSPERALTVVLERLHLTVERPRIAVGRDERIDLPRDAALRAMRDGSR
jgi:hypothetical protein